MNTCLLYEERLRDQFLAYQLIKRKLRTTFVSEVVKTIDPKKIRSMYHSIHLEKPSSGLFPTIEAFPLARESFLYMALFASIYQSASQVNIKTELDISAMIFAWDLFCRTFPNHARERRPFGRVRPANFTEAWVMALGIRNGQVELQYCTSCRHDFLIIYGSEYRPICQMCDLEKARKSLCNIVTK